MIEDYLYPQPLPDKLKYNFLRNTLKIGEYATFQGFLVSISNSNKIREDLWPKLAPKIGDFKVKGITPFPERDFPIMLVIVPSWLKIKGHLGLIEGKIYDLSLFSHRQGRFLLANNFEKVDLEKYLLMEPSGLDGKKIYNIFDSSFPETSRDIMLSFFLSSGMYTHRIGGCTVTLLDALSKYYASNFRKVKRLMDNMPSILNKSSVKIQLQYDKPIEVKVMHSFKIKYSKLNPKNAIKFYNQRNGREWEKSAITESTIKIENLIGSSDLPFIPYSEEMSFEANELIEYSIDIASFVLKKHMESPEIGPENIEGVKERLINKFEREFPLLSEAMKVGIIMDMADVNGFGEHTARLVDSWNRLGIVNTANKILEIYTTLFERVEDVLQDKIRRELSSIDERRRVDRIINRVLWELNILRPSGWDFFYFEKKLNERGIEKNAEKILQELLQKGVVIRKSRDKFLAVEHI